MGYLPNPRAGEWNQPDQIWVEDRKGPIEAVDPGCARMIVVPIFFVLSPLAYPLATAVAAVPAVIAGEAADAMLDLRDGPGQLALMAIPFLIVFLIGLRVEQRLGSFFAYRWSRYGLRIVFPAILVNLFLREDAGLGAPTPGGFIADTLNHSTLLTGSIVTMVLMVLAYFAGRWFRDDWHYALTKLRLRSRKLPD